MNLIFDYDGTLNNCLVTYRPAFNKAYQWLVDHGYAAPHQYTDKEISYWLGFTGTQMWETFQPDLPFEIREFCRNMIGEETDRQIRSGNAQLFPNTENVLTELKNQGFTILFLSNCRISYLESHRQHFHLEKYIDFFYCSEQFGGIPKYEIFRKFRNQHSGEYIMIGDRFHDIETAVQNHLKSVGCLYGYGSAEELSKADILVNDITEIPEAIHKLTK